MPAPGIGSATHAVWTASLVHPLPSDRTTLLVTSAVFVVLIGPSRIYLGDHWASDVLGAYLIGGVLLGLAVVVYLPLKERGVLQTPRARARMREKKALRSFPTKRWF